MKGILNAEYSLSKYTRWRLQQTKFEADREYWTGSKHPVEDELLPFTATDNDCDPQNHAPSIPEIEDIKKNRPVTRFISVLCNDSISHDVTHERLVHSPQSVSEIVAEQRSNRYSQIAKIHFLHVNSEFYIKKQCIRMQKSFLDIDI